MFLNNKYTNWYYHIINNRKVNPLVEKIGTELHHIIPKSLGGSDSQENMIRLTNREHFISHWLLTKMCHLTDHRVKMLYALGRMRHTKENRPRLESRFYAIAKRANQLASLSNEKLRQPRSEETKKKIREARAQQVITDETKKLWSKNRKGKPKSEEHKRKISESNIGKHSIPYTEERRKKQSLALMGKNLGRVHRIVQCPHCGKEGGASVMKRHHFDRCKSS